MQRPDCIQLKAIFLAPFAELRSSLDVCRARIFIGDCGAEEFEKMFAGFVTSRSDDCRQRKIRWKHGGDDLDARLFHKLQI